jgi:hypothetical protein
MPPLVALLRKYKMDSEEAILLLQRLFSRCNYLGKYQDKKDFILNILCLSTSIMITNIFKPEQNNCVETVINKIKENIDKIDWHPDRIEIKSYGEWLENRKEKPFGILSPEEVFDDDYPTKGPKVDDEGITLYTHAGGGEYFIDWERLKDQIDCLLFINHLCDKKWIHRENIQFIISYCGQKFNWGYLGKNKNI